MSWLSKQLLCHFVVSVCMFQQNDYILNIDYCKLNYYNPDYYADVEFKNIKLNRTYKCYQGRMRQLLDLGGSTYKVNIKAWKILDNIPKLLIGNFDASVCAVLEKKMYGTRDIFKEAKITGCPMKKGLYSIHSSRINENEWPPYIPEGRYKGQLTVKYEDAVLGKGYCMMEIIYKVKY